MRSRIQWKLQTFLSKWLHKIKFSFYLFGWISTAPILHRVNRVRNALKQKHSQFSLKFHVFSSCNAATFMLLLYGTLQMIKMTLLKICFITARDNHLIHGRWSHFMFTPIYTCIFSLCLSISPQISILFSYSHSHLWESKVVKRKIRSNVNEQK